jgi:hypothetical protein
MLKDYAVNFEDIPSDNKQEGGENSEMTKAYQNNLWLGGGSQLISNKKGEDDHTDQNFQSYSGDENNFQRKEAYKSREISEKKDANLSKWKSGPEEEDKVNKSTFSVNIPELTEQSPIKHTSFTTHPLLSTPNKDRNNRNKN